MRTTTAGFYRLMVCLWLLLGAQRIWAGYDAVVLDEVLYRVDTTTLVTPDTVFGSGRTCNLYLNRDEVSTVSVGIAMKIGFVDTTVGSSEFGKRTVAKRLNFAYAGFSLEGFYEQSGVLRNLGGNQPVDFRGCLWTDTQVPNADGTFIFGLNADMQVVTPVGQPIVETPGVPMNSGAYTVSADGDREVYELWIIGVKKAFNPSFINAYNNLLWLMSLTGPANVYVRVTTDIQLNSALSATEGCMRVPQAPMSHRFPMIYLPNSLGKVSLDLNITTSGQLMIKHGRMGNMLLQRSADMQSWSTVSPTGYILESLTTGDTKVTLVGGGAGSTVTHPQTDGPQCFYRLAVP